MVDGVWGDGVAGTDRLGAAEHGVNFQKKLRPLIVKVVSDNRSRYSECVRSYFDLVTTNSILCSFPAAQTNSGNDLSKLESRKGI